MTTIPGLAHAIDFGTTKSAITVCRPDGSTEVVTGSRRPEAWAFPTSLCVQPDGTVLVGTEAENIRNASPGSYRREFKREFGSATEAELGPLRMTTVDMSVHMLRFLRERAQEVVPGEPERVLVTVPASWEAGNQALMREAAARAGYAEADIRLLPEPVAALAGVFAGSPGEEDFTVLVYDLGGGTFDCALARGHHGRFEVLGAPGGVEDVGGADFDDLLLAQIARRLGPAVQELLDTTLTDAAVLARQLSIRDEIERFKWGLSGAGWYEDLLTALQPPEWIRLERGEFEFLIKPLVTETLLECERLMAQLGLNWLDVDRVVPIGGSSRIPLVQSLLSQTCGRAVLIPDDPHRAVIAGAAIVCHALRRGEDVAALTHPLTHSKRETMTDVLTPDHEQPDGTAGAAFAIGDIDALFEKYHDRLPAQRKPNIIVCGQAGNGKTTTINTLFGEEVGHIGHFSVGTRFDELYEWESKGQNIDVCDLPGLGDSPANDREYREMYLRRIQDADGFIVVVAPPRPAVYGTIRTVNLLLQCGVDPDRIVFAYNKVGDLRGPVNGGIHQVRMDGLAGPADTVDQQVIDMARKAFNDDLRREVHKGRHSKHFPLDRVVAYDAISGWNLFRVFDAVLESLPGDALVKWRDAVNQAAQDLQRRTEKRIAKENAEHQRQMETLQKENERLVAKLQNQGSPKKGSSPTSDPSEEAAKREQERLKQEGLEKDRRELERKKKEVAAEQARLERERAAFQNITVQRDAHVESAFGRAVSYVAEKTGQAVRAIGRFFRRK